MALAVPAARFALLCQCSATHSSHDTWMEAPWEARAARARKAVAERDMAAKKLDDVVFPNVQPPQLQNLGGVSAIALPLSLVLFASTTTRSTVL
jgi:hypothetical protein